jgi:hypothetical protein
VVENKIAVAEDANAIVSIYLAVWNNKIAELPIAVDDGVGITTFLAFS